MKLDVLDVFDLLLDSTSPTRFFLCGFLGRLRRGKNKDKKQNNQEQQ